MAALSLTSLPPEIRGAIFEDTLRPSDCNDVRTTKGLNLLAISKQIYEETCLMPFQCNTIIVPPICDSSTRATYELLRRMSYEQRNAIRKFDLRVTGSTLDVALAVKVLKYLRLGNSEAELDSEIGASALPSYGGDLREVTMTVSARDIAVPLADCSVGLQQALDISCCPIFAWLRTFSSLRSLRLQVRLNKSEQFSKEKQELLNEAMESSFDPAISVGIAIEVVGDDGYFVDELDVFPDSYVGLCGNVGPYPSGLNGYGR